MRKRFFILALVLTVIAVLLSAATFAAISNHIVLHGAVGNGRMLTVANAMSDVPPPRPPGVPADAQATKITLQGGTQPPNKGTEPDAPLAGGGWTCEIWQYAWQADAHTMAGDAAYNCSGATLLTFSQWADYCSPLLWGCIWQNGKVTYSGCTYPNPSWGACPRSGNYNYVYNIPSGQLWRERSYVCGWGPTGPSSCGTVAYQVQF